LIVHPEQIGSYLQGRTEAYQTAKSSFCGVLHLNPEDMHKSLSPFYPADWLLTLHACRASEFSLCFGEGLIFSRGVGCDKRRISEHAD
jgi:hypothetical protein